MTIGSTRPAGRLSMVVRPAPKPRLTLDVAREHGLANARQPREVREWKRDNEGNFERGLHDLEEVQRGRGPRFMGALWANVHHIGEPDLDLGLVSARLVTTAGVGFIVSAWQNTVELEIMKFHGIGTGVTAESTADTALVTEITTQYLVDNTRPAGTLSVGGSANIFETVATVTVDAAVACTEHGIFSVLTRGSGVLLDRSVFSVINLASAEGITFTYDLTIPAGG